MATPTEIANMYAQDTSGIESSNRFYAQLRAQKKAQEEQQKLQRDKFEYETVSDIGSFAPTNTAWDEKGSQKQQELMQKYVELGKKNPNMTPAERKQIIYPEIVKLSQWGQKAKQADAQIKPLLDMADKEMPWVDKRKLRETVYKKAFYDENGNLLDEPNSRWTAEVDLDNPEFAEQVANFDALPLMEQKKMKSLYAPQSRTYSGDGKTTPNYIVKQYDFEEFDPSTKQVKLMTNKVRGGNTEFDVLKEQALPFVPSDMGAKLAMRNIKRELLQNKDFNQLPDDVQSDVAMAEYMKRFGKSEASGEVKEDLTDIRENRKMQQQDFANKMALERLGIAQQANLRSAEKHAKAMKEQPNTPEGVYSTIVAGTLRNKDNDALIPEAQTEIAKKYGTTFNKSVYNAVLPNLSKETKSKIIKAAGGGGKPVSIDKIKGLVKMVDLSAANGGFFTDPFTQEKYKLISTIDNTTNDVVLSKIYQVEDLSKPKGAYMPNPDKPVQVIKNPDQELMLIGDQLKRKSDKILEEQDTNTELILGN